MVCTAICLALEAMSVLAQAPRTIPRPPADAPGFPRPEDGSAAPDGYAPLPQWLGQTRAPIPLKTVPYAVETFAQGISGPFSFNPLPGGRWIVAERGGHIRLVGKDGNISEVAGLPSIMWARAGQGLFEVRPDKDFAANRTVYLAFTVLPEGTNPAAPPRTPGVLTVASAKLSADYSRLEDVKVLLNAEGTTGRLIQARDGTLLISSAVPGGVGLNSADWPQPQQLDSDMGKILRINPDGSIPQDNPFVGRPEARPEIYALGLRDVQGVAIQPRTGRLWTSEHGPRGGDEINVVQKGKNYGFPVIGYGREYTGKPINGDKTAQNGMEQPVYFWTPDVAPAGIAFYSGKLFQAWQSNLFVSELAGRCLARLVLKGDRVIAEERLLTDMGSRIRDVNEGSDGALYVLTDGNPVPPGPTWDREGKILRLSPKQ
jgi:glucose/arabinose dehydrogenase